MPSTRSRKAIAAEFRNTWLEITGYEALGRACIGHLVDHIFTNTHRFISNSVLGRDWWKRAFEKRANQMVPFLRLVFPCADTTFLLAMCDPEDTTFSADHFQAVDMDILRFWSLFLCSTVARGAHKDENNAEFALQLVLDAINARNMHLTMRERCDYYRSFFHSAQCSLPQLDADLLSAAYAVIVMSPLLFATRGGVLHSIRYSTDFLGKVHDDAMAARSVFETDAADGYRIPAVPSWGARLSRQSFAPPPPATPQRSPIIAASATEPPPLPPRRSPQDAAAQGNEAPVPRERKPSKAQKVLQYPPESAPPPPQPSAPSRKRAREEDDGLVLSTPVSSQEKKRIRRELKLQKQEVTSSSSGSSNRKRARSLTDVPPLSVPLKRFRRRHFMDELPASETSSPSTPPTTPRTRRPRKDQCSLDSDDHGFSDFDDDEDDTGKGKSKLIHADESSQCDCATCLQDRAYTTTSSANRV